MPLAVDMARIFLLALYIASFQCSGFRIRRSGLAGFNDPYALSNAYSDLARRRRRTDYGPLVLNDEDSYFNPNSLSDMDDSESYIMGSPYRDDEENVPVYLPDYRYKSSFSPYRNIKEDPFQYSDIEKPVYTPQTRMVHALQASKRMGPTSMNELRKIFASADVPEKRLSPVKRREPAINHDISEENPSTAEQTKDLVKKVREILEAAEKITMAQTEMDEEHVKEPHIVKDVVVENVSPDGSTVEKLEDIIEADTDGDEEDNYENIRAENKDDESVIETPNNGENVESTEEAEKVQSKSKRASSKYDGEGYVRDLEEEVENLRNEVIRLQLLQILEDKENDYLANALKFATLDQLDNDDRLVVKEYNDISKATETEELIQQISNEDAGGEEAVDEEQDAITEDDDVIKRSELIPDDDGWLDGPVQESIAYGTPFDGDVEGNSQSDTNGSEFPIEVPYTDEAGEEQGEEEDEDTEDEDEAMQDVEAAVNQELVEASQKQDKRQVLQELLQGLNKEEVEGLITELKDVNARNEEEETLTDVCLPVLELSQNCAFADSYEVPIDQEARNLCSRHQMCYTCGARYGISQLGCNDGYKGEAIEACKDDDSCIRDSAIFLRLMERYHQYESYSPDECSAPCIEDFILG